MPQQPPDTSPLAQHAGQGSLQAGSVHQTHVSLPLAGVGVTPTSTSAAVAVAAAAAAAAAVAVVAVSDEVPSPSATSLNTSSAVSGVAAAVDTTTLTENSRHQHEDEDEDDDDEEDDDEDDDDDDDSKVSMRPRGSLKRHRMSRQVSRKRRSRYDPKMPLAAVALPHPASPNQDFFSDQEGPSCSSSIRRSITGMNEAYSTANNPLHMSLDRRPENASSIPTSLPDEKTPASAEQHHDRLFLPFEMLSKRMPDSPDTLPKSTHATTAVVSQPPETGTGSQQQPAPSQAQTPVPAPVTGKFAHLHHNIHSDLYKNEAEARMFRIANRPSNALKCTKSAAPSTPKTTSATNSNTSNSKNSTSTTAAASSSSKSASATTSTSSQINSGRASQNGNGNNNPNPNNNSITTNTHTSMAPNTKFIRRVRSRSLPIIAYTQSSMAGQLNSSTQSKFTNTSHNHSHNPHYRYKNSQVPPVPPINLQSLREIDLHEILKNPQLRHDILFDPQLQFRPNLDGERGRRKKLIIDKYWTEIQRECSQFFMNPPITPKNIKIPRLPLLLTTLRDILLLLLPHKDRAAVSDVMDISLAVQQLQHGLFDFVSLAKWLGDVFKSHCAPMRDQWVLEMINKFEIAYSTSSVENLVGGLRMIFSILEAMKLDVANHQIRILRPVLVETAVDFEKDYFNQLINHCKIDITDSLKWFCKNHQSKRDRIASLMGKQFRPIQAATASANASSAVGSASSTSDLEYKSVLVCSIIDLLSCRNMATEFPSTLAFDHTRLVLLRADVRQLVCVQLCICLYKQLCSLKLLAPPSAAQVQRVQEEILAIVTDDNGNVKWTRNVEATSLQLVRLVDPTLSKSLIDFSYNWLIKQIQPSSEVYGLMEEKIFKVLTADILTGLRMGSSTTSTASNSASGSAAITMSAVANASNLTSGAAAAAAAATAAAAAAAAAATTAAPSSAASTNAEGNKATEMSNILNRILTLVKFHWSVFGTCYVDYLTNN